MAEQGGLHKVKALQQRWISYQIAADVLLSASVALLLGSALHYIFDGPFILAVAIFIVVFAVLSAIRRPWQITIKSILNFLNQSYPELEESSELVLKPAGTLNLLESLQLQKVEQALHRVPGTPQQFGRRLKQAGLFVVAALVLSFALAKLPIKWHAAMGKLVTDTMGVSAKNLPPEKILPQIKSTSIIVAPPAYTNRPARKQDRYTLDVEEGAAVKWNIQTNIDVKQISLIFNEHEVLKMQAGSDKSNWHLSKLISTSGFYQVSVDGKLSDLYPVTVIKDAPPVIKISTPKQYTHIDAGEAPKVTINASVNDDYGISNAIINATVAKGSGEAVKFKEYKINFNEAFGAHSRQYNLQKLVDLPKLEMEPGDELYFYIQAQDTHQQTSRTDVYIVSIQDTAQLLSMDGLVAGVNVKPEFFRSERQIIIDSQYLIHAKDSLSKDEFNKRCNDLGADQKMLRLRYGKFLGEEDESKIGEETNSDLSKAENFSNTAMIMDAYTDKHDNAEDASFLEPAVKEQLKATLTEMWKAELQLRMYKPSDALPFEYKALRLLKDLQQKSRAYVAKTGYNPPPLKLEKRMTGDLSKIAEPISHEDIKKQGDQFETLKKAVVVLEQLKTDPKLNAVDQHTLQVASAQLSVKATAQPGVYLPAVSAMKQIVSAGKINANNIAVVEKAIQKALPLNRAMPQSSTSSADIGLSQGYFKNLNRINK
jgi:hypothetical protein